MIKKTPDQKSDLLDYNGNSKTIQTKRKKEKKQCN